MYPSKEDIRTSLKHLEESCNFLESQPPEVFNLTTTEKAVTVKFVRRLIETGNETINLPDEPDPNNYAFNIMIPTFVVLIAITLKEGMVHRMNHVMSLTLGTFELKDGKEDENDANQSAVH